MLRSVTMAVVMLSVLTALIPIRAAVADSTGCQQSCYVQDSRCDRDKNSGCSGALQSCIQACSR
ncbi:hypothetical protein [Erwinia sorbitola]|uniref:Uncharacterized protein n=1 Tax=Erwinia sorbitola TaxID=2681984 RepID=A0A6I6EHV1_9GAMM|nr:hypothetical protein [Erwinia sorbitola]MTD25932.1 hypothetical protein [Erwinia sorbitola]QGU87525.1 hypothetical protein GN242_09960 [Erwinia sorbitola]